MLDMFSCTSCNGGIQLDMFHVEIVGEIMFSCTIEICNGPIKCTQVVILYSNCYLDHSICTRGIQLHDFRSSQW